MVALPPWLDLSLRATKALHHAFPGSVSLPDERVRLVNLYANGYMSRDQLKTTLQRIENLK